ncbi:aminoacyl--tRNA ligase-related protein [Candidatus Nanohalobium constans]|uniref:proline--tRNA ligase n=1 Tax=Candidatus Nanohalobium constans TaxID=2565781 RepID=A0A5Q0UGA4_9ARCH|nr:aminoacyl--tRNA ligase-related protein [Candidatus Nanohalobium constans]QGA80421.1 prolyl-tRNA synthetase [Candidatus Nanohalobium constans]
MRRSDLFATVSKESVSDADCRSEELAIKAGLIHSYGSGTFGYTHLGKKVLDNIEEVIRDEIDEVAQEVRMNLLQTSKLWKESGRWKDFEGEEFFHFKNRDDKDFCLAATHEEAVVGMARKFVRSYRDLDFTVYQIGRKFRDDHARKGLLRAKEFTMKDAYSFHRNEDKLDRKFEEMMEVYRRIFDRIGLEYSVVGADNGSMGGDTSREFIAEAEVGSDTYMKCRGCEFGTKNLEASECRECGSELEKVNGIEVGHCFKLGTRYSSSMNLDFTTEEGENKSVVMGCYGIGVSRLISAIIEQSNDDQGITWNREVAAFDTAVVLASEEEKACNKAEKIYQDLSEEEEILLYEGEMSIGEKFAEADLIGVNRKVIVGNNFLENGVIEVEDRTGHTELVKEVAK